MVSRSNGRRLRPNGSKQQQVTVSKRKIFEVTEGLKSKETKNLYQWHFGAFLKWASINPEKLLTFEREDLENLIIDYLKYLHGTSRHLKPATINSAMAAIFHFCRVNAFLLNKERVSLFIPAEEDHKEDRAYTRKEIQKLLDASDVRFRTVFLLLANSMRVGAINQLQLGDLSPISINDTDGVSRKVYQIMVYGRSKKGKYYTFVTPECANAIDEYLKFRKKSACEEINLDTSPLSPSDSPLIREQFSLYNRRKSGIDISIPRSITQGSIEKNIERIVKKAGLGTTDQVMLTHGFRKWAITQMKKADVDFSDREYLVGHKHSRGLDIHYDRTTPEERLVEWAKAIPNLTIDKSFQLEIKLELIEGETNQKIAQQEQEIIRMRKEHAADKAFFTDQINRMRKGFLDREEMHAHDMIKAGDKYDKVVKERDDALLMASKSKKKS